MKIFSAQLKGTTIVASGSSATITGSFTGSIAGIDINATNTFTSSTIARLNSIETITSSNVARLNAIETITSSNIARISSLETTSASVNTTNTTQNTRLTNLESITGSLATTGSNTFIGTQTITGSLFISSNLIVQGTSSLQNITASAVSIGTNIVNLNTANPAIRYAGLVIGDSGSVGGSGSFLYDSVQDEMIFIHRGDSTVVTSSVLLMGPQTYDSIGSETYPTSNRIQKGTGNEHLADSCIWETGGCVGINTSSPTSTINAQSNGICTLLTLTNCYAATGGTDYCGTSGLVFQQFGNYLSSTIRNGGKILSIRESNYSTDVLANSSLEFHTTCNNVDISRLKIDSCGNACFRGKVGVGGDASASNFALTIQGCTIVYGQNDFVFNQPNGYTNGIVWKNGAYAKDSASIRAISTGAWAIQGLGFYTGNYSNNTSAADLRFAISPDGISYFMCPVGIGLASPTDKLHVKDGRMSVTCGDCNGVSILPSSTGRGGKIQTKSGSDWNDAIILNSDSTTTFNATACAPNFYLTSNTGLISFGSNTAINPYVQPDSSNNLYLGTNNGFRIIIPADGGCMVFRTSCSANNPQTRLTIACTGIATFSCPIITPSVTMGDNLYWNSGSGANWYIQGQANGPTIRMKYDGGTTNRSGALGWIDNSGVRYEALSWQDSIVYFCSTSGFFSPVGTTAQRPDSSCGWFRFNSDLRMFEGAGAGGWNVLGIQESILMNNYDPHIGTPGFLCITNNADGGGTTWTMRQSGIFGVTSTSGGHSGQWGPLVYMTPGAWRWRWTAIPTNCDGSIHGNTPGAAYKCTIQLSFSINGVSTDSIKYDTCVYKENMHVGGLSSPTWISTAGCYTVTYSTNGYEGVRAIYFKELILEKVR